MYDSCLHALDNLLKVMLLIKPNAFYYHFHLISVLVFVERDLAEDFIDFLLSKLEIFHEHLLKFQFLLLG